MIYDYSHDDRSATTLNLLGEISLLNRIIYWSWISIFSLGLYCHFLEPLISLYLYACNLFD